MDADKRNKETTQAAISPTNGVGVEVKTPVEGDHPRTRFTTLGEKTEWTESEIEDLVTRRVIETGIAGCVRPMVNDLTMRVDELELEVVDLANEVQAGKPWQQASVICGPTAGLGKLPRYLDVRATPSMCSDGTQYVSVYLPSANLWPQSWSQCIQMGEATDDGNGWWGIAGSTPGDTVYLAIANGGNFKVSAAFGWGEAPIVSCDGSFEMTTESTRARALHSKDLWVRWTGAPTVLLSCENSEAYSASNIAESVEVDLSFAGIEGCTSLRDQLQVEVKHFIKEAIKAGQIVPAIKIAYWDEDLSRYVRTADDPDEIMKSTWHYIKSWDNEGPPTAWEARLRGDQWYVYSPTVEANSDWDVGCSGVSHYWEAPPAPTGSTANKGQWVAIGNPGAGQTLEVTLSGGGLVIGLAGGTGGNVTQMDSSAGGTIKFTKGHFAMHGGVLRWEDTTPGMVSVNISRYTPPVIEFDDGGTTVQTQDTPPSDVDSFKLNKAYWIKDLYIGGALLCSKVLNKPAMSGIALTRGKAVMYNAGSSSGQSGENATMYVETSGGSLWQFASAATGDIDVIARRETGTFFQGLNYCAPTAYDQQGTVDADSTTLYSWVWCDSKAGGSQTLFLTEVEAANTTTTYEPGTEDY